MRKNTIQAVALLTATLALSACAGGGGGGAAAVTTLVDMTAVTGTGYQATPYVLPTDVPANTTGGIDDYIAAAAGYWQFALSGKQIDSAGNTIAPPTIGAAAVYDAVNDSWTVDIGGVQYVMTWNATENSYICDALGAVCTPPASTVTGMILYGNGTYGETVTKYGRFALIHYEYDTMADASRTYLISHSGLRTPAGDMPNSGSATYQGDMLAILDRGTKKQSIVLATTGGASVTVTANFGASTNTIGLTAGGTLNATGVLENGEAIYGAGGVLDMTGAGAITGNQFTGTLTANLTGLAGAADTTLTGSMAGAFYGPSTDEVVGYFDASGAVTTTSFGTENVTLLGGFATVKMP